MHKILITFPVDMEFSNAQLQQLDAAVSNICADYEQRHPTRLMWTFGHGALMTKNPLMLSDDEPIPFDEDTYHVEVAEREGAPEELERKKMRGHIGVSTQDPFHDIIDFHKRFGLEYKGAPRELPPELKNFRTKFMGEELAEYITKFKGDQVDLTGLVHYLVQKNEVMEQPDLEHRFDALIDLVYVALGTAYLHGFNFNEGWRRVHEANMKKVRAERVEQSARGSTFDVVKPAGWTAPDLSDLVKS